MSSNATGQQHPLKLYFAIWGLLFVLSAASYAHGLPRRTATFGGA